MYGIWRTRNTFMFSVVLVFFSFGTHIWFWIMVKELLNPEMYGWRLLFVRRWSFSPWQIEGYEIVTWYWKLQIPSGISTGSIVVAETGSCGVCFQSRWFQGSSFPPPIPCSNCLHVSLCRPYIPLITENWFIWMVYGSWKLLYDLSESISWGLTEPSWYPFMPLYNIYCGHEATLTFESQKDTRWLLWEKHCDNYFDVNGEYTYTIRSQLCM